MRVGVLQGLYWYSEAIVSRRAWPRDPRRHRLHAGDASDPIRHSWTDTAGSGDHGIFVAGLWTQYGTLDASQQEATGSSPKGYVSSALRRADRLS